MYSMASAAGVIVCSEQLQKVAPPPVLHRRSANYQPSTWDYNSICSTQQQEGRNVGGHGNIKPNKQNSLQTTLKYRVRRLLVKEGEELPTRLRIIHQLQSFGVAYHFEEEIKSILTSMHVEGVHHQLKDDLSSIALLFRMLRGHGLPASTDVFSAFRDDMGGFKAANAKDIDGFIALYEASYLAFPGEAMLDRARTFAIESLKGLMPFMRPNQREKIGGVLLGLPLHWRAPRLQAIWSLKELYNNSGGDDESSRIDRSILQLAGVDFNLVQALHRGELLKIIKWWKETGLGEKLPFARDRLVECFFCATCIAPEPRLAGCREVLAKVSSLIVYLDDIYDVYGTLDELAAFTDAIGRWNDVLAAEVALPEYMKAMYSAIWTASVTAADRVLKDHGQDVLPLYKSAWHDLCKAFLVEAEWQHQGYRPGFDEYLDNGWITSTGPLLLLHAFPCLLKQSDILEDLSKEITIMTVDSCLGKSNNVSCSNIDYPRLVELSSRIFRLCNDCATHKAESERGDSPSSIDCCMMDKCASEQEARDAVGDVIANTWKEFNKELAASTAAPCSADSMATVCLNLARVIHCIYHDGDGITSPSDNSKQLVKDLLFSPVRPTQAAAETTCL